MWWGFMGVKLKSMCGEDVARCVTVIEMNWNLLAESQALILQVANSSFWRFYTLEWGPQRYKGRVKVEGQISADILRLYVYVIMGEAGTHSDEVLWQFCDRSQIRGKGLWKVK
jgi:hypothetical protein